MSTVAFTLLLVVRIYDAVGVAAQDLRAAKDTSAATFRQAAIETRWLDCGRSAAPAAPQCEEPPRADELIVRIAKAPQESSGKPSGYERLGYAYVDRQGVGGALATVYVDRIATMAHHAGVDAATMLGRAMSHEIGHLLLGTSTHQTAGLMRAEWSIVELQRRLASDWRFTSSERAALAAHVKLRNEQAAVTNLTCAVCPSCPSCPKAPPSLAPASASDGTTRSTRAEITRVEVVPPAQ